jgi:magnesium transporter
MQQIKNGKRGLKMNNEIEKEFEQWLIMLDENKFAKLKFILNEENPANIAEFFEDVPKKKRLFVFRLLTKDNAAEAFSFMASDVQEDIVNSITDNEVRSIVDEMSVDDAVDFLGEMPLILLQRF